MTKWLIVSLFIVCGIHVHYRGRVRHGFWRQLTDHSSFMAPINCFMYLFSRVPTTPYVPVSAFPELERLRAAWPAMRAEAEALFSEGHIKASARRDDAGFNSFFKSGWKRFYLKWYGTPHPSAQQLCPQTSQLLAGMPTVKAAMFAALPPGSRLVRHRDPYAGSLRYHLGLITPNDDACFIEVDGERYSWRDGEAVIFDETYIHYADNQTTTNRIILFCDLERPMRYRWAQWVNRAVGRVLLAAAASPNQEGDRTGALNKAFGVLYAVRQAGKALKRRSKPAYYAAKWALILSVLGLILL
ncbi:lipid A hydroxylase LpxO [Chitiniphilus purpureus]|uniref:Lipid A hydroxylase LpxO n=1 Tax=Chitiniphilus purpureus TaxID=2981137 RepID=A0ABY6DPV6_9NEIS|nr:lipid A hydroxylase LpxO [Chitiniphilus sp. CD1]UXY15111.1 lipid A hydroxylase LpxO [Chitiniphilus sp. CD1]